jgi:hypothetical protein
MNQGNGCCQELELKENSFFDELILQYFDRCIIFKGFIHICTVEGAAPPSIRRIERFNSYSIDIPILRAINRIRPTCIPCLCMYGFIMFYYFIKYAYKHSIKRIKYQSTGNLVGKFFLKHTRCFKGPVQ